MNINSFREIYSGGLGSGCNPVKGKCGRPKLDLVTGSGLYKDGKFYPTGDILKDGSTSHFALAKKLGFANSDDWSIRSTFERYPTLVRIAAYDKGTYIVLEGATKEAFKDVIAVLPKTAKRIDLEWWKPQPHMEEALTKEQALDLYAARKLHKRIKHQGMDISVENRAGSVRSGVDPTGRPWRTKMQHDYGYVKGSKGLDGGGVDCFVGPNPTAKKAYVVHIMKPPDFKEFDEDKCMLGFNSASEAKKALLAHYDSPKFFGSMEAMPVAEFRQKAMHTGAHGPMRIEADAGEPNVYPGGMGHIEPTPTVNPPSLKNPKYIPSPSDPRETDDTFLDVSRRHDKATEAFRNRLTKQHPEPHMKPLNKTLITGFPAISVGGFG